ncbi:MAG: 30S ribosomal protein S18 [uncultured bacterium]|nr:MAG: 30S ribosomal protein S18 [uncultured bacterium]
MIMQKRTGTGKRNRFYVKALESLNYEEIDYKHVELLRLIVSNYAKILPGKRTGAHARMQRQLSNAVKRARFMALLPYTRT